MAARLSWLSERPLWSVSRSLRMVSRLVWFEERLPWSDITESKPLPDEQIILILHEVKIAKSY